MNKDALNYIKTWALRDGAYGAVAEEGVRFARGPAAEVIAGLIPAKYAASLGAAQVKAFLRSPLGSVIVAVLLAVALFPFATFSSREDEEDEGLIGAPTNKAAFVVMALATYVVRRVLVMASGKVFAPFRRVLDKINVPEGLIGE